MEKRTKENKFLLRLSVALGLLAPATFSAGSVSPAWADTPAAICVSEGLRKSIPGHSLEHFRTLVNSPRPEMRTRQWSSRAWKNPHDGVGELFAAAADLAEADRPAARAALASSPLTKSLKSVLSLALYDEAAWLKQSHWADVAYAPFDAALSVKKPWSELLRKMPASLRGRLDAEVRAHYAEAPKGNRRGNSIVDWPDLTAGPKRGMDAYLRITGDVTRPFLDRIASGESPVSAYAEVLKAQRDRYFRGSPVGDYDPLAVFEIARGLQPTLRRSGKFAKGESVSLTGSFVNGKAQLSTSDIDIAVGSRPSANLGGFNFSKLTQTEDEARMKELARTVRALVVRTFGSKRILPPEKTPVGEERRGLLNPFAIRVYGDRLELLVYPIDANLQVSAPVVIAIPD